MSNQPVRLGESATRLERSWEDQAAYHRKRAGQERRLALRSPNGSGAAAHTALAERHDNLANAAQLAGVTADSAKPATVEPRELLIRAGMLTPYD